MAIPIISKKLSLVFLNTSFLFLLFIHLKFHPHHQPTSNLLTPHHHHTATAHGGCSNLHDHTDYKSKCLYVKTESTCRPKGYINYLEIFYCRYGKFPLLGHAVLLLWLAVLFYLLGNTAAQYFCSTLEGLSKVLNLSPTIAGVTLLSLGNGAPDVFASIVSFTRSSNGDVGLNSILGGAFFVSSVVVGVISIVIAPKQVSIDKASFFRDVLFLLFALCCVLLIVAFGKISFWGSICFVAIYFVYVCSVSTMQIIRRKKQTPFVSVLDYAEMGIPLLGYVDDNSNNDQNNSSKITTEKNFTTQVPEINQLWYVMELPLYLPRRLTIPLVCDEKWSKPYAVASATLAPILLAALCNTQMGGATRTRTKTSLVTYMVSGLVGVVLGNLAHVTTKKAGPPKRWLLPWLAGGFLMSVTWTYITAEELVSLLVSIGNILGISASVLGLTVLAWGNSLGDLIANVAMAMNGGPDGAQIAISGCYAGPMFNTLVGLGLSLVFSSCGEPYYVIPSDHSLYETVGFLIAGLLWALVILPKKNMRLDRFLGGGLLAIYLCFLFLRLAKAIGVLNLEDN